MSIFGLFGQGGLLDAKQPEGLLGSRLSPNLPLLMTGLGMLGDGWAGGLKGMQLGLKEQTDRRDRQQALADLQGLASGSQQASAARAPAPMMHPAAGVGAPMSLLSQPSVPQPALPPPNFSRPPAPTSPAGGSRAAAEIQARRTGGLDPVSRDLAIRTVLAEAGNQGALGMSGVANVIRNRVQSGRYGGDNVGSVVRARNQFEPWNTAEGRKRIFGYSPQSEAYRQAGAIVDEVFGASAPDPTRGATHFFAPQLQAQLGRNAPAWARDPLVTIGGHTFYAPEGAVASGSPRALASTGAATASAASVPGQTQTMAASTGGASTGDGGLIRQLFAGMSAKDVDRYARLLLNPKTSDFASKFLIARYERMNPKRETTDEIRNYEYARQDGYRGSFEQWRASNPNSKTPRLEIERQGPDIVGIDPTTGQEVSRIKGAPQPAAKFGDVTTIRKEIQDLDSYRNYAAAVPAFNSMTKSLGKDSKAADLDFVYGLAKIFDPASVVREGEMVLVNSTQSLPDQVLGALNSVQGGQRLTAATRNELLDVARGRVAEYDGALQGDLEQFRGIAQRYGINEADIIPNMPKMLSPQVKPSAPQQPYQVPAQPAPAQAPAPAQSSEPARRVPETNLKPDADGWVTLPNGFRLRDPAGRKGE